MDDNKKQWGLVDLVTTIKNLVISANTINQTLGKAFPSWAAGQIPGTTTNGDATAGNIGEYISSTVVSGSAVALTTGTAKTITSITLTGGDWDIFGTIGFIANAATTATAFSGGINNVTNTLPAMGGNGGWQLGLSVAAAGLMPVLPTGTIRVPLSTTATYYLIAQSTFAVNSMSAFGSIAARRRR